MIREVSTNLGIDETIEVWLEVEEDSVAGVRQRDAADEEDNEDDVRKQRCYVHHLAIQFNPYS